MFLLFQRRFLKFFLILVITLTALLPLGIGHAQVENEIGSDRIERKAVHTKKYMVVAANPIAASVGSDILKRGGNAIDAAIALPYKKDVNDTLLRNFGLQFLDSCLLG
jgi:gamma-glutamyltranspeptidase/glutathione hydrolase